MPGKGKKFLSGVYVPRRGLPLKKLNVSLNIHSCQAWRVGD